MHMYYIFGIHICSLLSMTTMYSFFGRHFVFCIYVNNFGNYTHVYNAHEVLHWQCKIFYTCRPYLFFHIYDALSILCLALFFFFCKCLWSFTAIHKHFTFGSHSSSSTSMATYQVLFWQPYFFFLLDVNYLLKLCKHMYVQSHNANKVLRWQYQIFYICILYLFFYI